MWRQHMSSDQPTSAQQNHYNPLFARIFLYAANPHTVSLVTL